MPEFAINKLQRVQNVAARVKVQQHDADAEEIELAACDVSLDIQSSDYRCQPSRNRAGNPAFWHISRIPAFLPERPAFQALFRNNKNWGKSQ